MTRHAVPRPLGERWLEAGTPGTLAPADLARRLDDWRAREESWRRSAPFDIEGPGARPTREARGFCDAWFPLEQIARDVRAVLRARFGKSLAALETPGERDAFDRSLSWLDATRTVASLAHTAVPSKLIERIATDRDAAEALAFELHDPAAHGCSLDRYPDVLSQVVEKSPAPRVRAWDAGCGTGEGAVSLARALACGACGRESVEVVATTPSAWELLMARRRGRPHDAARTRALRAAWSRIDEKPGIRVDFCRGDLRSAEDAPRDRDVVLVAGVIGGVISDTTEVSRALEAIALALAPRGCAYVCDRFRADRRERARSLVAALAPRAGLAVVETGAAQLLMPRSSL